LHTVLSDVQIVLLVVELPVELTSSLRRHVLVSRVISGRLIGKQLSGTSIVCNCGHLLLCTTQCLVFACAVLLWFLPVLHRLCPLPLRRLSCPTSSCLWDSGDLSRLESLDQFFIRLVNEVAVTYQVK
jgi:hypothetical protein